MFHVLASMRISSARQLLNNLSYLQAPLLRCLFFSFYINLRLYETILSKVIILMFIKAFIIGGLICVVGQILIDKTKLTPARILVMYVVFGVVLGAFGLFKPLEEFAGAGATVPLLGFGAALVNGTREIIDSDGAMGIITGPLSSGAGGIMVAVISGLVMSCITKPRAK